jgi:hypothetical protein
MNTEWTGGKPRGLALTEELGLARGAQKHIARCSKGFVADELTVNTTFYFEPFAQV